MSVRPWRCFVAVPIDDGLRESLAAAVGSWRAHPDCADLRWTDADAWHLTIAFLGPTDPGVVSALRAALERVTSADRPFAVPTGGLGAFPTPARATVAWYAVGDPAGRLARLAAAVRRELGMEPERRPFRPHLTLARVRGGGTADLRGWLGSAAADAPQRELPVDELRLVRSHLGSGPARYETLAATSLGTGAPVGA